MANILDMYPSKYLKEGDLKSPLTLTISRVTEEKVGDDMKPVLRFQETGKMLSLNKTNAKSIAKLHGSDYTTWTGKQIELYWNPDVQYGDDTVGGVRVRAPRAGNGLAGHGVAFWSLQQAQEEAGKVGITKADIVASLKAAGFSGWRPDRDTAIVQAMIAAKSQAEESFGDDEPASLGAGPPMGEGEEIPFSFWWLAPMLASALTLMGTLA